MPVQNSGNDGLTGSENGQTSPPSIGDRVVSGARWSIFGQWARFGSHILSVVILARILTPEDYGLFGVVSAIAGFAAVIGDFGLSSAAIQAKSLSHQQRSNLLWINSSIGLFCGGALALLAESIGEFFDRPMAGTVAYVMSLNFVLVAVTTQFLANVTRELRFKLLFIADLLSSALGLLTALVIALTGGGVWALVAQQLVLSVVKLLILSVGGRWAPSFPSTAPMKGLLSFGIFTFSVQVLTYGSRSLSSVFIGRFQSVTDVGFYDRAQQINAIPSSQLSTPLARVVLPVLSKVQDDTAQVSRYLARAENILAYIIGTVMVTMAVLADLLVRVALGPGWEKVALILSVLSLGGFFSAMGFVLQWGFMVTGRVGLQLGFSIFTRSLMICMIAFAAPHGVIAVATASSLGLALNWLILYLLALPRTGISLSDLWPSFIRPVSVHIAVVVICIVSKVGLGATNMTMSLQWMCLIVILFASYSMISLIVRPIRRDIISLWRQITRKVKL